MSEDSGASVEIYIDGEKKKEATRYEREDVLNAITGYGGRTTNTKPGYKATIDMKNYTDGEHKIDIKVKSSGNNVISECSKIITVKKYETQIYIDSPYTNQLVDGKLHYQGWVMSEYSEASVKVYIDGEEQENPTRYKREDVLNAITGYGGRTTNTKPGYKGSIDYNKLSEGYHIFKVEVIASSTRETIASASTKFLLKKYNTKIEIESPTTDSKKKTTIDIKGWVMSEDKNGIIELYIDNNKIDTTNLKRTVRTDVLNAVIGYGDSSTNPTPGFELTIDSKEINDGSHTFTVKYVSSESTDVFTSVVSRFYIKKYDGILYLDSPIGSNFSSDFIIEGWEMSECLGSTVKVFVDNNQISITRKERNDVIEQIKDYGNSSVNPTPGFVGNLNIANYNEGFHTLSIKLYSIKDELIDSISKKIFISKGRYYGVDVSQFNGNINWNFMRKAGIDYAFIRGAYRGYGTGKIVTDSKFYDNMDGCLSSGIKCGVYFFSQAITYNEGVEEADFIINLLENSSYQNRISLPIVIDSEYSTAPNQDGRADFLIKAQRTQAVKGFVDEVSARKYTPMIYASTDWLNNNLDLTQLGSAKIWVADWRQNIGYTGTYQVWQYSNKGNGPSYGVSSQKIDLNYFYKKY